VLRHYSRGLAGGLLSLAVSLVVSFGR